MIDKIENNKINKNDTKKQISEKINKCNEYCVNFLKEYNEIFDKISSIKNIGVDISNINNFINNENGLNKINEIKEYYCELFKKDDGIRDNIKYTEDKINELYDKIFVNIDNNKKTIEEKLFDVLDLYKQIIEDNDSIKNKIYNYNNNDLPQIQETIEKSNREIQEYRNRLLGTSEEDSNSMRYNIGKLYDKIKNYNNELFSDSDERQSIKSKIENLIKETQNNEENRKKIYEDTKNELDSLLPDAGSIGLTYSYNKAKQDYGLIFNIVKNKNGSSIQKLACLKTFFCSFFFQYLMFLAPLIIAIRLNYSMIRLLRESQILYFPFENLMFTLPLLWISWFGYKNIVLRRRMYEEYNHKEKVLAMFSSLRDELQSNKNVIEYCDENKNKREMTQYQRLVEIVLNTVEYNPSKIFGIKEESIISKFFGIQELKIKAKSTNLALKIKTENDIENKNDKIN